MRNFHLSIDGARQGKFKGGRLVASRFEQRVASPRDTAAGGRGGKRTHEAIVIRRPVDAATPQFLHAACTGEELRSVLCEFPHRPGDGEEEIAFTVKLLGAVVSAHHLVSAEALDTAGVGGCGLIEEISFAFQRIEWAHCPGKTMAADAW
jgi:type VI secretion system Hcp family effector